MRIKLRKMRGKLFCDTKISFPYHRRHYGAMFLISYCTIRPSLQIGSAFYSVSGAENIKQLQAEGENLIFSRDYDMLVLRNTQLYAQSSDCALQYWHSFWR